jgi:hypothetical protein
MRSERTRSPSLTNTSTLERSTNTCSFTLGEHRNHDPLMSRRVPEDVGIAEVGRVKVSHGIARIVCPGSSAIVAEGGVLFLSVLVRRRVRSRLGMSDRAGQNSCTSR